MTYTLSQVTSNFDTSDKPQNENNNNEYNNNNKRARTLKKRPPVNKQNIYNKLKVSQKNQVLTDDIYLDNSDEPNLFDNKPEYVSNTQDDDVNINQYKLLGNGNEENNYAEEKYKRYLNKHKQHSPLLAQSEEYDDNQENSAPQLPSYAKQYPYKYPTHNSKSDMESINDKQTQSLMKKLNYMIHLLEEQKNEQTNNVTEELILYMFLGVFVIFVVDSFARAGKYTR